MVDCLGKRPQFFSSLYPCPLQCDFERPVILLPLTGLVISLANKIQHKRPSTTFKLRPQDVMHTLPLGTLPRSLLNKSGLVFRKINDHKPPAHLEADSTH